MRAMVLRESAPIRLQPLRLEEWPDPEPPAGCVRVKVRACAVCRTDLHVIEADLPPRRRPIIPGHQAVGIVDQVGPNCQTLRVGDRVGVAWLNRSCGACPYCRGGRENLCVEPLFTGYHEQGGFAEAIVAPEAFVYPLPEAFDDVKATPLLCAGIIGYRALARSQTPPGGKLLLVGFGSSAHVVLQLARARGCEVYVATRGARHRELARELGATWVGEHPDQAPATADGAILFAPAGELVPPTLAALDRGATLALAGIHLSDIPPLNYQQHLFHERQLCSVTANTRDDGRRLLAEAAAIPVRPHTTTYPLAAANQALLDLKNDNLHGTAVLVMDQPG